MKKRKMAMVASQVKIDEEDLRDIQFWLDRPASERIAEVTRLRRAYYSWLLGTYPQHMEKTVTQRNDDI
ncbi:hypothetical protein JHJ32_21400 [Parapedobacter sp. ISTM3]|uniref:Uncharacterized protein n=1 Tax=Parapedobacter composti TaxID=623281 RepID=A0A1I1F971_9SPHI|nr:MULTISPECIES: hypothetical protein [Parapedobacter]MBK1442570.1 hypothetical protein [Parapedobacter sp. ISTM3]SFB96049.1 hypothetical protein SAMN05421747_102328 [Parapedobacter composti]